MVVSCSIKETGVQHSPWSFGVSNRTVVNTSYYPRLTKFGCHAMASPQDHETFTEMLREFEN